MLNSLVKLMLGVVAIYLAMGAAFAVAFHWAGLRRLDAAANGAGWFFRVLITPGIIALWPVLGMKWAFGNDRVPSATASDGREADSSLRTWHRRAWWVLVLVIPALVALALWFRPAELPKQPLPAAIARPRRAPGGRRQRQET
jgi:hypothetical protein